MTPPDNSVYPLNLIVDVWSDDISFRSNSKTLKLHAKGKTSKASFDIEQIKTRALSGKSGRCVYLRGGATDASDQDVESAELIGVFRLETSVLDDQRPAPRKQLLENAFLANDWFRFNEKPSPRPDITLFLRKEAGNVQLFSCFTRDAIWGGLEINEEEFYAETRRSYVDILRLSLASAKKESQKQTLPLLGETAAALAATGHNLYAKLFSGG